MLNCEWIDFDADLTEQLIKRIYANSLYDPQFLADVLAEYEKRGRDRVRCVYQIWISLYEWQRDQELKPVAREIARKIDTEYERKVKEYEWKKKRTICNSTQQNNCLMQQKEKLLELRKHLQ